MFGSGYLTNVGTIPALVGAADLIVLDELSHSSLLAGAELSGAASSSSVTTTSRHADALLARSARRHRHCLLVTDGVFSMEGDLAPLADARRARAPARRMAHDRRRARPRRGRRRPRLELRGRSTPSTSRCRWARCRKPSAAMAATLCASRSVVELLRNRARSFVYSTGLPPGTVAAAIRALDIIATDRELVRRPVALARLFTAELDLAARPTARSCRSCSAARSVRCAPATSSGSPASSSRRSARRPCRPARRGSLHVLGRTPRRGRARAAAAVRADARPLADDAATITPMSTVFITSSGTGIGKTFVTSRLIAELKAAIARPSVEARRVGIRRRRSGRQRQRELLRALGSRRRRESRRGDPRGASPHRSRPTWPRRASAARFRSLR